MIDKKLLFILIPSFLIKIIFLFFFHEATLGNEWRVLFNNFDKFKIFSYYNLQGENLPSSYMPPLYLIFLFINKLLSFDLFNFIFMVYFSQVCLSTISVILFYKLCQNFFDRRISLIGSLFFAFIPLLIFSNALISSASLQIFLYLLFLNFCIKFLEDSSKVNTFTFAVICALCLLLRGEFLVIFVLTIIFFFLSRNKKITKLISLIIITLLLISPYLIRNYINTSKIHIVNVTGYALWKGNNHLSKVEGYHIPLSPKIERRINWPDVPEFKMLYEKLDNLKINRNYEIERDKIFLDEAKKNILSDKKKYFHLYFKKVLSYYFIDIDSSIENYYSPFHIYPLIMLSILSLIGIIICFTKKNSEKILFVFVTMICLIFLISLFYILPRYKISIIIFQTLFSLYAIEHIVEKFKNKYNK